VSEINIFIKFSSSDLAGIVRIFLGALGPCKLNYCLL